MTNSDHEMVDVGESMTIMVIKNKSSTQSGLG